MAERALLYIGAVWLMTFGVWPAAHPEHWPITDVVVLLDWCLHLLGFAVFVALRWEARHA